MKKSVLLVGSSYSAVPILFALKKYGCHVTTCGNIPSDPGHHFSDDALPIDYSDRDWLLEAVKSRHFDYLVPSGNDFSYLSTSWVAQKLGYPGFDSYSTTEILHTKNKFRDFTQKNIPDAPRVFQLETLNEIDPDNIPYPLLIKPDDSSSGKGVAKIQEPAELAEAISSALAASRSNKVIIEEFVEGSLHSHSAFIQNKDIFHDFFVDEFCTVYPYQVNCSNHPSVLTERMKNSVRETIKKIIEKLDLNDGLLHTQFIAGKNRHWIIECMRRAPGDLYGHLIELSTGVNYTDLYVRPFLGKKLQINTPFRKPRPWGRHTISTGTPVDHFMFSHRIPAKTTHITPLKTSGERLEAAPYDKLAILFAEFSNKKTMLETTPDMADMITIKSVDEIA